MSAPIARPCEAQCETCDGSMMGSQPSMRMMQPIGGDCLFFRAVSAAFQWLFSCDFVLMSVIKLCSSRAL